MTVQAADRGEDRQTQRDIDWEGWREKDDRRRCYAMPERGWDDETDGHRENERVVGGRVSGTRDPCQVEAIHQAGGGWHSQSGDGAWQRWPRLP